MNLLIPNVGKKLISRLAPDTIMFSRKAETRAISLTFDDGPHPENTPLLLDILSQRGVKGNFFVVGSEAEKYPDIIREIHSQGHLVCNHGHVHLDASRTSGNRYAEDINQCQILLNSLCATSLPKLFRPPFGKVTLASLLATRKLGFKTIMWDRDSRDSHNYSAELVKKEVLSRPLTPGSVLLFHDDYKVTPEVLPEILDLLLQEKHQFSRLDG